MVNDETDKLNQKLPYLPVLRDNICKSVKNIYSKISYI